MTNHPNRSQTKYRASLMTAESDDAPIAWGVFGYDPYRIIYVYSWREAHDRYQCRCDQHDMNRHQARARAECHADLLNRQRIGSITDVHMEEHGGVEYVAYRHGRYSYLYRPCGYDDVASAADAIVNGMPVDDVHKRAHRTGSRISRFA
jgi:hypothetical protein